jgi:hypothetical protein
MIAAHPTIAERVLIMPDNHDQLFASGCEIVKMGANT